MKPLFIMKHFVENHRVIGSINADGGVNNLSVCECVCGRAHFSAPLLQGAYWGMAPRKGIFLPLSLMNGKDPG